jgi:hypothetical protein
VGTLGYVAPAPLEKSVDDLLGELEGLRAQKLELEKKEQELKVLVRKKLDQQTERLKKLGIAPTAAVPDRIGQIILEGNTTRADEKILGMLGFRPGQVLAYPALEEARRKLEKAGFRDVTVEVLVSNPPDAPFKDIRVKVTEPAPKPALPK